MVAARATRRRPARTSHLPPCSAWNSKRSSSPQPNTDDRSALTSASSSLGSSTARSVIRRSRTSRVAVHERARLGAVRDAGVVERALEEVQTTCAPGGGCRCRRGGPRAILHAVTGCRRRPASARRSRRAPRPRRSRPRARVPRRRRSRPSSGSTPRSSTPGPRGAPVARCSPREVLGLRARRRLDQPAEHVVDPGEHRLGRPEVGREPQRLVGEVVACREERGDVGAPEAVDRLLRVADEERAGPARRRASCQSRRSARRRGREQRRDLDLDRVGVLELVEEQRAGSARATPRTPAVRRSRSSVAGQHQQVVELELARAARPLPPCAERRNGGDAAQRGVGRAPWRVASPLARRSADCVRTSLDVAPASSRRCPTASLGTTLVAASSSSTPARRRRPRRAAGAPYSLELGEPREQLVVVGRSSVGVAHDASSRRAGGGRGRRLASAAARRCGRGGPSCRRATRATRRRWSSGRAAAAATSSDGLELGIVEQVVTECRATARRTTSSDDDFVVHLDARRQAGLDRERGEDPLRERSAGCRSRRRRARRAPRAPLRSTASRVAALAARRSSSLAHTIAQLGRGLLGEGDRGDARIGTGRSGPSAVTQLDDPLDEHGRLAGARAGLDEQRLVEPRADRITRGAIGEDRSCRPLRDRADQLDVVGELGRGALAQPGAVRVDGAEPVGIAVSHSVYSWKPGSRAAPGTARRRSRRRSPAARCRAHPRPRGRPGSRAGFVGSRSTNQYDASIGSSPAAPSNARAACA